ncbi:MAG: PEP-CTERM sorting domain-containing protein [Pirellulales bacterium]|nr:PEP-CTERM sorting domain-containing protein [Pirellulales bacterium]
MLMVLRTSLVVLAVAVALISGSAIADSTWTGGGDGVSWSDAANWDSGVPVNGYANIGNTATDRVIVMDQVGNKAAVNWTQTDDASNTIRVDTDWTQCCYNAAWTWDNSGGRIGYDLNGNTLETLDGGGAKFLRNFDLEGPGTWHVNRKFDYGAGAQIGAGVTVRSSWAGGNFSAGGNEPWDPTATLLIDDGGGNVWTGTGTIGNLKVNAGKTYGNNGTLNVQSNATFEGNMTMHGGLTQQFRVAGNVSVLGAGDLGNQGKLILNGAAGTVQQLDIQNPTKMALRFEGESGAQLLHDLDSSQAANVNPHESLITGGFGNIDLNGHDASFNRLVMVAPEITWGVSGSEQSVINIGADGAHFIASTDVTINNLGGVGNGWAGGDLTLFNVDDAATVQGSFSLGTLTLPNGWSSDGIAIEGKNVVLKNVGVPEPTSLMLLAVGLLGAWIRRR